jgi:hypothetical protein
LSGIPGIAARFLPIKSAGSICRFVSVGEELIRSSSRAANALAAGEMGFFASSAGDMISRQCAARQRREAVLASEAMPWTQNE